LFCYFDFIKSKKYCKKLAIAGEYWNTDPNALTKIYCLGNSLWIYYKCVLLGSLQIGYKTSNYLSWISYTALYNNKTGNL